MKSVQRYLKKPLQKIDRWKVETAKLAIENAMQTTLSGLEGEDCKIEIHITNRRNPNGLVVTRKVNEPVKVERFINMGWATRNGYATR